MKPRVIIGPPGTGKTRRLLNIVEEELDRGTQPDRIAFMSFTRKAAHEAADRAITRFDLRVSDLPHFRTLHSQAYRTMGVRRDEVMQARHFHEIGGLLGLEFSTKYDLEEGIPSGKFLGDRYSFLDAFARARRIPAEDAWHMLVGDEDLNWFEFDRFRKFLVEYKQEKGLLDFSDMLLCCDSPMDIDVAIIDEAQDLSTLQWDFVWRTFRNAKRVIIAGDDDQAIYAWSGADVHAFVTLDGDKEVLEQSWRVPAAVHRVAGGIAERITERREKVYRSKAEEGEVQYHLDPNDVDLSEGKWLLLARNVYMLRDLAEAARSQGLPYKLRGDSVINKNHLRAIEYFNQWKEGLTLNDEQKQMVEEYMPARKSWEEGRSWYTALSRIPDSDREFYISLLRRGEKLDDEPRINISTIHGAKGGEADNVLIMTDVSARTYQSMELDPDNEHRVFYVGVTRTRRSLHIIQPTGRYYYDL